MRQYEHATDYERVGEFLTRTYRRSGGHINWLQPRWEYMHYHPLIRGIDRESIGIWEAKGAIVGVVHPEHGPGTVYFEVAPDHDSLKTEMLAYAEEHLSVSKDGARRLRIFIHDADEPFRKHASAQGYSKSDAGEETSVLSIPEPFPAVTVPPGCRLKSLAEDNDLHKLDRVLWRGFGHGDEPPADGIADREFMQSAPNYSKDLNIVVEAPDGNFASYCGMWFEPVNAIAYVEPVATDPAYRRLGLGGAAVLEGVRRCGELGASVAYVGTAMPFYLSMGFRFAYGSSLWQREWTV